MRAFGGKIWIILTAVALVAGCSGDKQPKLLNIQSTTAGPDEFSILPNKPLEQPETFAALPEPTPGGTNRGDATPNADAIVALGGNPNAAARPIPASDGGLINHTSRFGRSAGIRQTLAAEDLEFRRRKDGRVLERLFNVNVYFRAYRQQSLDQYAELEKFRRAGVRTPAAPPNYTEN